MVLFLVACWSTWTAGSGGKDSDPGEAGAGDSGGGGADSGDSGSGGTDSGDSGETGSGLDADGDGYSTAEGDCDDTEADIHPGATETCDGHDEDCDGETDENAADATVWYLDSDGDGYGDDTDHKDACDQPASYVSQAGDCDVVRATVNPGEAEVCNGLDDDCDGGVDVGATDAATWYEDADEDGWGGGEVQACEQPAGTLGSGGDCDDADPTANPDAAEVCDGADQDCDGDVDESGGLTWYADADGDGLGDDATATVTCFPSTGWTTVGGDCDDADGAVLESAPVIVAEDFEAGVNGEVVTGLDCVDDACTSSYCPYAHRGLLGASTRIEGDEFGVSSGDFTRDYTVVVWFYDKRAGSDRFVIELGTSATTVVAWAGFDTDKDTGQYTAESGGTNLPLGSRSEGWHRLVVEATYATTTTGTVRFTLDEESPASLSFSGYMSAFWFDDTGSESAYVDDIAAWAGTGACAPVDSYVWYTDWDGDGYGDPGTGALAAAAPADSSDNQGDCDDGEVLAWADAVEVCEDGVDQDCDGEFDGCGFLGDNGPSDADSGVTGAAFPLVATGGDVDGDGSPDVLLGGNRDYVALFTGGWEASQYFGYADVLWEDDLTYAVGLGIAIAPDLNGDGCDDVAISDQHGGYSARVIFGCGYTTGERTLWSVADATLTSTTASGDFGAILAATPDADGDGNGELFVGDYNETGGSHAGVVFRADGVTAGTTNLTTAAAAIIVGDDGDYLGTGLASAGDTEGTGGAGILVGAYQYDGGSGTTTGRVSLFDAGLTGALSYDDATWSVDGSPDEALGNGTSTTNPLAGLGDADGDGYADLLIGSDQTDSAYIFFGPFEGRDSVATITVTSTAEGANGFGRSVCGPIDADGDRLADAVIADPTETVDGIYLGRAYVFTALTAAGSYTTGDAAAVWTGQSDYEELGWGLAAADLDLDGRDDLVVTTQTTSSYILFGGEI